MPEPLTNFYVLPEAHDLTVAMKKQVVICQTLEKSHRDTEFHNSSKAESCDHLGVKLSMSDHDMDECQSRQQPVHPVPSDLEQGSYPERGYYLHPVLTEHSNKWKLLREF